MKLYINNPQTQALTLINDINNTILKLNTLFSNAEKYNICTEENQKLRSETLPIFEAQETRCACALSSLESKKSAIESALKHLSPLQLVEKKRLQQELEKIENEISLQYNNYTRAKESVSNIIHKITSNSDFIDAHPLLATIQSHQHIINKELNPAIKKLSNIIKTPLVTYNPNSLFYFDKFEVVREEKFELEQ